MTYIGGRLWQAGLSEIEKYRRTANMTEVKSPARTLMFSDAAFLQYGVLIEYSFAEPPFNDWGYACPSIHFRHRNKANISWCDGHVDSKEIFESNGGDTYDGDRTAHKLGWFEPIDDTPFDLR
jgi:prepilin-type processing-associated H-X9-DG protein